MSTGCVVLQCSGKGQAIRLLTASLSLKSLQIRLRLVTVMFMWLVVLLVVVDFDRCGF